MERSKSGAGSGETRAPTEPFDACSPEGRLTRVLPTALSGPGQRCAAPVAVEKLRAEIMFQRADLPAERWLRHVQETRRANEAEFLGNGYEITQPP